ncbi:hypothetical protein BHM03_00055685 [Ensete ventricosum]|nr:hypothetical protein BHM03_00055685 [Ensete ventricosum]
MYLSTNISIVSLNARLVIEKQGRDILEHDTCNQDNPSRTPKPTAHQPKPRIRTKKSQETPSRAGVFKIGGLPGLGKSGMTRMADAIRGSRWSSPPSEAMALTAVEMKRRRR